MSTNAEQLDVEWLEARRLELGADPVLLEKAVRCLNLVATLRREGLDFLLVRLPVARGVSGFVTPR